MSELLGAFNEHFPLLHFFLQPINFSNIAWSIYTLDTHDLPMIWIQSVNYSKTCKATYHYYDPQQDKLVFEVKFQFVDGQKPSGTVYEPYTRRKVLQ